MAIVIVTQNQYLIASRIHYINLNESYDYVEVGHGRNRKSIKEFSHSIHIMYTPDSGTPSQSLSSSREDYRECNVSIRGKVNAHRVYRDLIRQIREQMPDQLFLDKALETLLGQELSLIEHEEKEELELAKAGSNDRSSKKVRSTRKTQRRSKKVLRRAKSSR